MTSSLRSFTAASQRLSKTTGYVSSEGKADIEEVALVEAVAVLVAEHVLAVQQPAVVEAEVGKGDDVRVTSRGESASILPVLCV